MADQPTSTPPRACELSPPSSQGPPSNTKMTRQDEEEHIQPESSAASLSSFSATAAASGGGPSSNLNSNGKRKHPNSTQGQGHGGMTDPMNRFGADDGAFGRMREKDDVPGWAWKNMRAQDESAKAMGMIAEQDRMIGKKYGDPAIKAN